MLQNTFFNRDPCLVARELLGKIILRKIDNIWLAVRIIETEAYYLEDKASHASLGLTPSRAALFMPAGTIYMYHARGQPSLNVSCRGDGNAVLIKSAYPYFNSPQEAEVGLAKMRANFGDPGRSTERLANGQTILCRALYLTVEEWGKKQFCAESFFIEDKNLVVKEIIQTTRLGIPQGRDEHLPYRFIDEGYIKFCTKKPRANTINQP